MQTWLEKKREVKGVYEMFLYLVLIFLCLYNNKLVLCSERIVLCSILFDREVVHVRVELNWRGDQDNMSAHSTENWKCWTGSPFIPYIIVIFFDQLNMAPKTTTYSWRWCDWEWTKLWKQTLVYSFVFLLHFLYHFILFIITSQCFTFIENLISYEQWQCIARYESEVYVGKARLSVHCPCPCASKMLNCMHMLNLLYVGPSKVDQTIISLLLLYILSLPKWFLKCIMCSSYVSLVRKQNFILFSYAYFTHKK